MSCDLLHCVYVLYIVYNSKSTPPNLILTIIIMLNILYSNFTNCECSVYYRVKVIHVHLYFREMFIALEPVFLISSYGAPLAQRTSYFAQHSSLFGPDGTINYDCIVTNSINSLLISSKCVPNGAHTNHCCANLAHASKRIKNSAQNYIYCILVYIIIATF